MKKNKTEDKQSLTPPLQDRHSLIGPFLWGFMALITCFGSTGCTKRLEQALEAQTAQLETLNSRLTRCEQQWQATADDFILLNQMAMRDLDTFRQEQEDLRDKIQAMDESWIVESEYVRHRQKQFQEGLVEVNTSIVATDRQIQSVQENLDTKIDDRHASLSQAIDTSNEQLALLHTRANELARDANAVQQKLRAQLTAGNTEIGEHLDTLALNQEGLQQTLDQTQTSAGLAVEQLQLVNAKQDRLAQWTQEHSEQLNQVALGESSHNQALKADTARLARHLEQLTAQHNQWTEQAGQQARQQNNQQAQLIDVARDNSSKLDHLQFTQDENTQKQQAKAFGYYNSLDERLATIEEQGGQLGEQVTHLTQGQEGLRADAESQLSDLTTNWQQQSEDVSAQLEALRQGQRELDVHDSLQQIAPTTPELAGTGDSIYREPGTSLEFDNRSSPKNDGKSHPVPQTGTRIVGPNAEPIEEKHEDEFYRTGRQAAESLKAADPRPQVDQREPGRSRGRPQDHRAGARTPGQDPGRAEPIRTTAT